MKMINCNCIYVHMFGIFRSPYVLLYLWSIFFYPYSMLAHDPLTGPTVDLIVMYCLNALQTLRAIKICGL